MTVAGFNNTMLTDVNFTSSLYVPLITEAVLSILFGIFGVVGNVLVLLIIATSKELHTKDMFLVLGLAGFDLFTGFASILNGFWCIRKALREPLDYSVRSTDCLLELQWLVMPFGAQGSSQITMLLALDRALAVLISTKYKNLTVSYVWKLNGAACLQCVASVAILIGVAFNMQRSGFKTENCVYFFASTGIYFLYHYFVLFFCGLASVVFYVIVTCKIKALKEGTETGGNPQFEVAKTTGAIVLLTTLLVTIPSICGFFITKLAPISPLSMILVKCEALLMVLNSSTKIFVCARNYKAFRAGIKLILKRIICTGNAFASNVGTLAFTVGPGTISRHKTSTSVVPAKISVDGPIFGRARDSLSRISIHSGTVRKMSCAKPNNGKEIDVSDIE